VGEVSWLSKGALPW